MDNRDYTVWLRLNGEWKKFQTFHTLSGDKQMAAYDRAIRQAKESLSIISIVTHLKKTYKRIKIQEQALKDGKSLKESCDIARNTPVDSPEYCKEELAYRNIRVLQEGEIPHD